MPCAAIADSAPDSLVQRILDSSPAEPPSHWFEIIRNAFAWWNTGFIATLQAVRAAINRESRPTDVEGIRRYAPSFQVRTIPGVNHGGAIWMHTELFDRHVRDLVRPMLAGPAAGG